MQVFPLAQEQHGLEPELPQRTPRLNEDLCVDGGRAVSPLREHKAGGPEASGHRSSGAFIPTVPQPPMASTIALLDPELAAEQRERLAVALLAAGGRVAAGRGLAVRPPDGIGNANVLPAAHYPAR